MDFTELPAALAAAGARVEALDDELPDELAALILATAQPPRRSGALDASGRVEDGVVVFGGGVVTYAAAVEAVNPFLQRATDKAAAEALGHAAELLGDAIAL